MARARTLLFTLAGGLLMAAGGQAACSGTPVLVHADPATVLAWVQATQPQAWDALVKNHGGAAEAM